MDILTDCDSISFLDFEPNGATVSVSDDGQSITVVSPPSGGSIIAHGEAGAVGGATWAWDRYLCFDVEALTDWSQLIRLYFWIDGHPTDGPHDMLIDTGVFPRLKARIAIPLQFFDSQRTVMARTAGRRKSGVRTNASDPTRVTAFAIALVPCFARQTVTLSNLCLLDDEPDYPLPNVTTVDALGQLSTKDWPGKTYGVDQMVAYLRAEAAKSAPDRSPDTSRFGGWKQNQFEATGWFRAEHDGQRWWLVDPDGYAFFSQGLDQTQPGQPHYVEGIESLFEWLPQSDPEYAPFWDTTAHMGGIWRYVGQLTGEERLFCYPEANLYRAFGDDWWRRWAGLTKRRLSEWGLNSVGNWSQREFIEYAGMPYVWPLADFPETETMVFRDFPDVFSPEYEENSRVFAQQLEPFADDPLLIGYFLRNEPNWAMLRGLDIAEEVLASPRPLACRDALIDYLRRRYDNEITALARAWSTNWTSWAALRDPIIKARCLSDQARADLRAFSEILIRRYVSVPSEACRRVDPNHLSMGLRWAFVHDPILLTGTEHFDVLSINCYQRTPSEQIMHVGQLTNKPVVIGEFHFGALDRGMTSTGLRGVTSQTERGVAWRHYVESCAATPYCVGVHYFILNDQPAMGRMDGENYQIGLVDVCHRPYTEFVREIAATSETLYEIASGERRPTDVTAVDIGRVG